MEIQKIDMTGKPRKYELEVTNTMNGCILDAQV
jgi:hypothetical protein